MSLYGINIIFFLSISFNPEEIGIGDKFFFGEKRVWSKDPCQLPVTQTINCFELIALLILKALVILSDPVLQKIIFLKFEKKYLIVFANFTA
jgi:hypothetical protein